jgi:hypothetical protein
MADVCNALEWTRYELPHLKLEVEGLKIVAILWSSRGQLAMSLGWAAPARGLSPPEAVLAFYSPTDYEDQWWRAPIVTLKIRGEGMVYLKACTTHPSPATTKSAPGNQCSPRAQIVNGTTRPRQFFIHGADDGMIPSRWCRARARPSARAECRLAWSW